MSKQHRLGAIIGLVLFAPAFIATLFLSPEAYAVTNAPAPSNVEGFRPRLAINIPTIQFSGIVVDSNTNGAAGITGYLGIPWIAEYMRGIYSYAVIVAVVLAGVMFVVGGFYYLTAGGDASRVQMGRKRISDAVIGLLLVFGAYTVLANLNPALTAFEELRVKRIKSDPFQQAMVHMGTTTDPTMTGGFGEAGGGDTPRAATGPAPSVGAHSSVYPNCPVPLTEVATSIDPATPPGPGRLFKNDPRSRAFFERVSAHVASIGDLRQRILAAADAADKCGVHMNSCGSGAGAVLSVAGVGNGPGCIDMSGGHSCWAQETSGMSTPRGGSFATPMFRDVINSKCGVKDGQPCGAGADSPNGACAPDGPGAVARARRILQAGYAGYPDSFANLLQPGDILWVYNANGGNCTGLHSVIFMGWASNGKAQVVQGQDGRIMRAGQTCISTRCNGGNNYTPPIRIYRARGL